MLRFIAPGIPFYITSAMIPHSMLQDIKEMLHIPSSSLLFQRSNDQHNIALCVKKMQYPISLFEDLAFLLPSSWAEGNGLPCKFMVFFDSKHEAKLASIFLQNWMPEPLKHKVKWFHAGMMESFRTEDAPVVQRRQSLGAWHDWCGRNGTYAYHAAIATALTPAFHFQGVDILDVLTVVQWRASRDLNMLMQWFGCAAWDFSLQGAVILIAEPRWFLKDHQKRLTQKRKQNQKGKRKVSKTAKGPSLRQDIGVGSTRRSDVSSSESDNELDSGGETENIRDNNMFLDADKEGAGEVEEAITAGGRGCKWTTNKVMWLFINAHLLHGRKHCHCFHTEHYYRTVGIGKSIILRLRLSS